VDDAQADNGLPPQSESDETLSESNHAESLIPAAATIESIPSSATPTNGSSPQRVAANRRNAKKSTGPKTSHGKTMSSWNSTRHGLLSNRLPPLYGRSKKRFNRLLRSLQQDLEPVGALEEVLVEKIAQEYWRLGVAAWHEADDLSRETGDAHVADCSNITPSSCAPILSAHRAIPRLTESCVIVGAACDRVPTTL
jgi:hypothetical protein